MILLRYDKYYDTNPIPMNKLTPQAHIWTSRGCPFKCIFCVWPASMTGNDPEGDKKRSVRQYSKDYIASMDVKGQVQWNKGKVPMNSKKINNALSWMRKLAILVVEREFELRLHSKENDTMIKI